MSGEINFKDSLKQRIKLIKATKMDVSIVSKNLNKIVTKSFLRNKKFIKNNNDKIFFISGGFKEMLLPSLKKILEFMRIISLGMILFTTMLMR